MAAFAHFFGIRPWEWDRLTYLDTVQLMAEVDDYQRRAKEAERDQT